MSDGGQKPQRRASIIETIGVWLHLSTPPRDTVVPPVPWRKLAIGAVAGAVLLGIVLAVMIPRIESSKADRAAADRAASEKSKAARAAIIKEAQRAQSASAAEILPAAQATDAEVTQAREQLLASVRESIFADAQSRAEAGEIRPVIGPTTCDRAPGTPASGPYGVFDCYVVSHRIKAGSRNRAGSLGYSFRAVVDYGTFGYTWCKAELPPGEKVIQWRHNSVPLPDECQAPKA